MPTIGALPRWGPSEKKVARLSEGTEARPEGFAYNDDVRSCTKRASRTQGENRTRAGTTMIGEPIYFLDVRFARDVERLHSLGPRPITELLAELGCTFLIRTAIEVRVREYVERLSVLGRGDQ